MKALEENELLCFAISQNRCGNYKIFSSKKSVFVIVESIISFISFSKGPWKLNKTIFYDLQPKDLIYFDQIETKLTSEMEEEKPFIFAGFSLPTRSCLVCFHMMTFSWQKGVGKNTSRWSYVTKFAAPNLLKKSLLEGSIQFLITKLQGIVWSSSGYLQCKPCVSSDGFLAVIHLFSVNGTEFKIGRFTSLTLFYSIYYQERIIILYLST